MDKDKPKVNFRAWEPIEKRQGQANKAKKKPLKEKPVLYKEFRSEPVDIYLDEEIKKEKSIRDYSQPKYNILVEKGSDIRKKKNKRRNNGYLAPMLNPQLLKVIVASFGAIATGIVFGLVILNVLANPKQINEPTTTNSLASQTTNNQTNSIKGTAQSSIAEQEIYLLQAGAFSNQSGAQAVAQNQKSLGKAAVVSGNGPFYVFVGVSTKMEEANILKELLKINGGDVFVKKYTIPEYKANMSANSTKVFLNWASAGEEIINILSQDTINSLSNPNYVINYTVVQKLHQQFLLNNQGLNARLTEEGRTNEQKEIQKMAEQINYAITALTEYQKNPNPQYLWNIQEKLINFKFGYVKLQEL